VSAAEKALEEYLVASGKAWSTFVDYRSLKATESQVAHANAGEARALAALREAIGNPT
jgi:hypothetical protein